MRILDEVEQAVARLKAQAQQNVEGFAGMIAAGQWPNPGAIAQSLLVAGKDVDDLREAVCRKSGGTFAAEMLGAKRYGEPVSQDSQFSLSRKPCAM